MAKARRGTVRKTVRWLVSLAIVLAVGRFVALAFLDHSAMARALVWMAPDARDFEKFPARAIAASHRPLHLPPPVETAPQLTMLALNGMPFDTFLDATETTAFLVAQGETLLHESYALDGTRETRRNASTLTLAFVSTLIGQAVADGYVDPDDPVALYLPEFTAADPRRADITLRHLLTMASGLGYRKRGLPWSDDMRVYYSPDLRRTAMATRRAAPPGQSFAVNMYNPLLLGMVLERATGQEVALYLERSLWQPMGAEGPASWSLDSEASGFERMAHGLNARPVDLLKLGILFAQEGRIGRQQVLDPAWVAEATRAETVLDPSDDYQFFWRIFPDSGRFAVFGDQGQVLYVDPARDLALLRLGRSAGDLSHLEWIALMDRVIAALAPPAG